MTDQTKKVSEFPIATSIAGADRLLILSSPSTNPTVKTVPTEILIANIAVVGGYVTTAQLAANLSNYVTTTQLNTQISSAEANNALYFNGFSVNNFVNTAQFYANLENYVSTSQFVANLSNYVTQSSLSSNLSGYVTIAGLASNVVKLNANNTSFLGGLPASSYINSSALDATLASYVTATSLTLNLSNYQTRSGLSANVLNLTSNNTLYVGLIPAGNVVSDVSLAANLADYVTISNVYTLMATANANNAAYLGGIIANDYVTSSELSGNLSNYATITYLQNYLSTYQIPVNLGNVSTLTIGNSSVNTYITPNYVKISNTTSNITLSIPNTTQVSATNYFLNANGAWAQVVTGFTNSTSISVNNFVVNGTFTANGSNGSSGQVLTTNGTGVYWANATGSGGGGGSVGVAGTLTIDANNEVSWDANAIQVAYLTMTNNATLLAPTNMSNSGVYMLYVIQDATGGWTLDYANTYKWAYAVYPVHTTYGNSTDIVSFTSNGSAMFGVAQFGFE